MTSSININNQIIDVAAIEARARKLRAEAVAEFGRNLRTWIKNLSVGFSTRTAH